MAAAQNNVMDGAADAILHLKVSDDEKRLLFPATRYANVVGRPTVVADANNLSGAPFGLYKTDTENVSIADIRSLVGPIV